MSWNRIAACVIAVWLAVVGVVTFGFHPIPLYSVESDVIGTYIPAARDLAHGQMRAELYQSKGFGYPLLLSVAAPMTGGDYFLASKIVNVAAALGAAVCVYLLFRGFLGAAGGVFVLLGTLLNPAFARAAVETGTDMPAFALLVAATWFVLSVDNPWRARLAGLVAGIAIITRTNCAFLVPAGLIVLATRPGRRGSLVAYIAGLVIPLGLWNIAARGMGGSLFGDQNVANVAYEMFGRGLSSDEFGATIGPRLHSLRDVIAYDPGLFAARIATNIATRWLRDAHELLPVWIGALALPGMVLGWRGRPGWPGLAVHAALAYLVLVPVFYLPRFGLYLIPFYVSGVVALLLDVRAPWLRSAGENEADSPPHRLRLAALTLLLAASAWPAATQIQSVLAVAPVEAREGGETLRRIGAPGDRVMARKPHVAYFAGLDYVPIPATTVTTVPSLIDSARSRGVRFLFFSNIEKVTRPQLAALGIEGVAIPGLRQIEFRTVSPGAEYALYEFTHDTVSAAMVDSAALEAIRRGVMGPLGGSAAHLQLATGLLDRGQYREALLELAMADANDSRVARAQAFAHFRLGENDPAIEACERAMGAGGATDGWAPSMLGAIRMKQKRPGEAITHFRDAIQREPANMNYIYLLGTALYEHGERKAALREFDKVLAQDPRHPQSIYYAARIWQLEGNPGRALAILGHADPDSPGYPVLEAFADSLRR